MSDCLGLDNIFLQSILDEGSNNYFEPRKPKKKGQRIRKLAVGKGKKSEEGIKITCEQSSQTEEVQDEVLQVSKLSFNAIMPTKATIHAAGYDLYSAHLQVIPARGQGAVSTDLQIRVPRGTYGRIGI